MGADLFNLFHCWNARLCPPIGLFFNFILIFLVQCKTPKEMRNHSRILLQTGILDIFLLLMTIIVQPAISTQPNVIIILFDGYFSGHFDNNSNFLAIFSLSIFAFALTDIFGLTVQFLYRYLVLNRDFKIGPFQYFLMLFLASFPHIAFVLLSTISVLNVDKTMWNNANSTMNTEVQEFLAYSLGQNDNSTKFIVLEKFFPFLNKFSNVFFPIFTLICYGIIGFCCCKIARFVNSNLTGRKKELSKQLNWNLIMLAILPIIYFAILAVGIIAVGIVDQMNGNSGPSSISIRLTEMSLSLLIHWVPVLNPLVSILVNGPYRKAVFEMATRIFPIQMQTTNT